MRLHQSKGVFVVFVFAVNKATTKNKMRIYNPSQLRQWLRVAAKSTPTLLFLSFRGGSRIFFRRGCTRLLLYFNTNKPHSVFAFFFLHITSCIRKPQVISGRGGAHPLHPPPRSAPELRCF